MATTIAVPPRVARPPDSDGGRGPSPPGTHRVGILLGIAAISMMFIGLTSAYVVGQGLSPFWRQIQMRPLIWINTAVLLCSSYSMERARRETSVRWLLGTLFLGIAFLAGQIGVFGQLANEGVYLSTGRQASFFYVLTGLHGLHVLGGIFALGWSAVSMKAPRLEATAIYWHFMGGLFVYLLLVIFL